MRVHCQKHFIASLVGHTQNSYCLAVYVIENPLRTVKQGLGELRHTKHGNTFMLRFNGMSSVFLAKGYKGDTLTQRA
jgi:hypothetical protein